MYFSYTFSILLTLPSIYSVSTSAQALTQNQTCANACTAAQACDHQCVPGTGNDPYVNTDIYNSCLCQSGCLCNAEICVQCCEAGGNNDPEFQSCPFIQLAAGDVLAYCSIVSAAIFPSPVRVMFLVKIPGYSPFLNLHSCLSVVDQVRCKGRINARKSNPRKGLFRLR